MAATRRRLTSSMNQDNSKQDSLTTETTLPVNRPDIDPPLFHDNKECELLCLRPNPVNTRSRTSPSELQQDEYESLQKSRATRYEDTECLGGQATLPCSHAPVHRQPWRRGGEGEKRRQYGHTLSRVIIIGRRVIKGQYAKNQNR